MAYSALSCLPEICTILAFGNTRLIYTRRKDSYKHAHQPENQALPYNVLSLHADTADTLLTSRSSIFYANVVLITFERVFLLRLSVFFRLRSAV